MALMLTITQAEVEATKVVVQAIGGEGRRLNFCPK